MTNYHSEKSVEELLRQKEFAQLKYVPKNVTNIYVPDELVYGSQQLFVNYFMNPNTENKRLICKHSTGSGKTTTSLSVALKFLNFNKYKETNKKIIIIGYTKSIFARELINNPSLGFVTKQLKNKFYQLLKENPMSQETITELNSIKGYINSKINGQILFYGYKELYQKFFVNTTLNATNIWNVTVPNYEKLYNGLKDKSIVINENILNMFDDAFVICDEIHNVYNSKEFNNYGLTLQLIFNLIEHPEFFKDIIIRKKSSIWILLLSATLINTSPTEIVDLINLIVPITELPNNQYIKKSELFDLNSMKLLPTGLGTIRKLLFGYVSYYVDNDSNYPSHKFVGESIKDIDYIKFDRCVMSKLHYATYESIALEMVSINDMAILDGIIPNIENEAIGLYQTKQIISMIQKHSDEYKTMYGIELIKDLTFTGSFAKYTNIGNYSSKYHKLLTIIFDNLKRDGGKIMIIHQYVKYWGVLFIQELLLMNGFIKHDGIIKNDTLCSVCGIRYDVHDEKNNHIYNACRFITIYGNIDKSKIDDLVQLYRQDNTYGHKYKIVLGSQLLNQSYNFTDIRELILVSNPISYSELIQIRGRSVRKYSHINLPPSCRNVEIRILVSSIPNHDSTASSLEEIKYRDKSHIYRIIQTIDKTINECAIDNYLFHDYILEVSDQLITKQYDIMQINPVLDTKYFDAHYVLDEINIILLVIKRLFVYYSSIWEITDLWKAVLNPPFYVAINTNFIKKSNFIIVINNLCGDTLSIFNFDYQIQVNGVFYRLILRGNFIFMIAIHDAKIRASPTNNALEYSQMFVSNYIDVEPWNKIYSQKLFDSYDLKKFIKFSTLKRNMELEMEFFNEYKNKPVYEFPITFEIYSITFHKYFIEKLILYFFNFYVNENGTIKNIDLHNFYLNCMYFYDELDLLLFADQVMQLPDIYGLYSSYVYRDEKLESKYKNLYQHNPFLYSTVNRKRDGDVPYRKISQSTMIKNGKVLTIILPIGHFINKDYVRTNYPSIYNPGDGTWITAYNFNYISYSAYEQENDIIVGYYHININSLEIQFKLRVPLQQSKNTDARFIERGAICSTKGKSYLVNLKKKLNINTTSQKTKDMCEDIKTELFIRELNEIEKWYTSSESEKLTNKKIKWIYFPHEKLPHNSK